MKLTDALKIVQENKRRQFADLDLFLVTGFTPLHLEVLLIAHVAKRVVDRRVTLKTGLYGDLAVTLRSPEARRAGATVVILEWSDIDPRLGLRRTGGWTQAAIADILVSARVRLSTIQDLVAKIAADTRVVLSAPTLPLPPAFREWPSQTGAAEAELRARMAEFGALCAAIPGVRLLSAQALDTQSPLSARHDVAAELAIDFPYRLEHASVLAETLARLLAPTGRYKGVITDLDDTLWRGLVGEVGADGVSWNLDAHSQVHAIYQQTLAALADQGVLIAIASKNTPDVAGAALRRQDLGLPLSAIFPIEISWAPKSEAVQRILQAWNIGEDSVIFVDDSPIEIAEVQSRFPQMRCLQFTTGDDASGLALARDLRDLCGTEQIAEEDRIRLASLRTGQAYIEAAAGEGVSAEFLAGLDAEVVFSTADGVDDDRSLDLINKTNQFNLNGRRLGADEWRRLHEQDNSFVVTVAYKDKFGPLGKIAIVAGEIGPDRLIVKHWVQSCRAFSRMIEHRTLHALFALFEVRQVDLAFEPTARNKPIADFLALLGGPCDASGITVPSAVCEAKIGKADHLAVRINPLK